MTATLTPSLNGTIKLARRGLGTFQFGEDGLPFTVDVVALYDEFCEVEWEFCDENNKIIKERRAEWKQKRQDWVQAIVNTAYEGKAEPPTLTRAETDAFIARIVEEADKLRPFTVPSSDAKPSSPESTEIRFGQ